MVKYLVEHGASINIINKNDETPLCQAYKNGYETICPLSNGPWS